MFVHDPALTPHLGAVRGQGIIRRADGAEHGVGERNGAFVDARMRQAVPAQHHIDVFAPFEFVACHPPRRHRG